MKVIRLNGNDIGKLVRKIIKEDNEWFDEATQYNLTGIYTVSPIYKLGGVSEGGVLEVTEVKNQEATIFISYNLKAVISGYPYSSEGPYKMDVNELIEDITDGKLIKYNGVNESHAFSNTPSVDERIANHILEKLKKERPDIHHQFVDYTKNINNFYDITASRGALEADLFRVDFNNKSSRIDKNTNGNLVGGDFGIIKVYNVHYKVDLGKRKGFIGYAIKLTDADKPLNIPDYLIKEIYRLVESQYGDIKVFKTQRKIDKGTDDETELFDQLHNS